MREVNSLSEIGKRLWYLLYVALWVAYMIFCIVSIARPRAQEIAIMVSLFLAALFVRRVGYKYCEFERLRESFPCGSSLDMIPEEIKDEVEQLFDEFHTIDDDWVRRQEIRHRLIEIEEISPEVCDAYRYELKRILC